MSKNEFARSATARNTTIRVSILNYARIKTTQSNNIVEILEGPFTTILYSRLDLDDSGCTSIETSVAATSGTVIIKIRGMASHLQRKKD